MPNHSIKKKKAQQNTTTIDEKHTQLLEEFNMLETETIPQLEAQRANLKKQLAIIKKTDSTTTDQRMDLKDQIRDLGIEIKTLKAKKSEYLLSNAPYIFSYFEQKKKISSGEASTKTVLNSFFKIKPSEEEMTAQAAAVRSQIQYKNYWRNVDKNACNMADFTISTDQCQQCGGGELIPQDEEGILICNNPQCSVYVQYIVDNEKPTYKEPPNEVTYNAYVRLNHFKEILSQFQAKETTQIPPHVMNEIKNRIKKERITDIATEINYEKMREILKKLGFNRYFEHIQFINSILGIKPPIMSDELQETLCNLFIEIQEPWAMHCPANRTNFFNCTYTLYQLCVLLDQTQYLPFIPMMKDRDKQFEQDMVWKKVCETLDWEFIPTV